MADLEVIAFVIVVLLTIKAINGVCENNDECEEYYDDEDE